MEISTHSDGCECDDCNYSVVCYDHLQTTIVCSAAAIEYANHLQKYCIKRPLRDSSLAGHKWIWELWHGHERRFFQNMQMRKPMLRRFIQALVDIDGLPCSPRNVTLEESLAIFLLVIGQGATYPVIEERLQRSSETVSNHFHMVLKAVCRLGKQLICPTDPSFSSDISQLRSNHNAWPYFKDAIGAIDGTHISIHVADAMKVPWINRKGLTTTNVLATCDFNMCITYAAVGMKGSMHDSEVLNEALRQTRMPFPVPPPGKYYLADAGYPLIPGFLTPYRRSRYHLPEFRHNRTFRDRNELFNYRHSSLRNVIEHTFGVLKKRWRVLSNMPLMNLTTQLRIIWACFTLHNFIRRYDSDDIQLLREIPDEDETLSSRMRDQSCSKWAIPSSEEAKRMELFRNTIRDSLNMT